MWKVLIVYLYLYLNFKFDYFLYMVLKFEFECVYGSLSELMKEEKRYLFDIYFYLK